jgi:hypothetical protein
MQEDEAYGTDGVAAALPATTDEDAIAASPCLFRNFFLCLGAATKMDEKMDDL